MYQNGFARLKLSAVHHAVVGGFKVARKVAGLVKGKVVRHGIHRIHGRNRIRGKAAVALVRSRRARPRVKAGHIHLIAHFVFFVRHIGAFPGNGSRVFQARCIGQGGNVLVLATGHQDVHPRHRRAVNGYHHIFGLKVLTSGAGCSSTNTFLADAGAGVFGQFSNPCAAAWRKDGICHDVRLCVDGY